VEEERGRLDPGREGACERAGAGPCESWVSYVGSPRRGRDDLKGRGVGADAPRRGAASAVMVARGARRACARDAARRRGGWCPGGRASGAGSAR
jgi:hypothetical protein